MIRFTYENKTYELEYNRQSVRQMESQGFNLEDISSKPMTTIPLLFRGAFYKNHRGIKTKFIDELYEKMTDKSGLLNALLEEYSTTLSVLTEDNEEAEGNVTWEVSR